MDYKILEFIIEYLMEHSYAPSIREIQASMKIKSAATVHYYMKHLYQRGLIETDCAGGSRAYRVKGMKVRFDEQKKV